MNRLQPVQSCLLTLLASSLTACGTSQTDNAHALTAEELRPLYSDSPAAVLQPVSSSPLGETHTPTGRVAGWSASKPLALYLDPKSGTPPAVSDGSLEADGQVKISSPLMNVGSTLSSVVSFLKSGQVTYCPVDEMTQSREVDARVWQPQFIYFLSGLRAIKGQKIGTQTSPIPTFGYVRPVNEDGSGNLLLWVSEAVDIRGESRCLSGFDYGYGLNKSIHSGYVGQSNTLINVQLEKGWNAIKSNTRLLGASAKGVNISETLWSALPAAQLTNWTAQ